MLPGAVRLACDHVTSVHPRDGTYSPSVAGRGRPHPRGGDLREAEGFAPASPLAAPSHPDPNPTRTTIHPYGRRFNRLTWSIDWAMPIPGPSDEAGIELRSSRTVPSRAGRRRVCRVAPVDRSQATTRATRETDLLVLAVAGADAPHFQVTCSFGTSAANVIRTRHLATS